MKEERNVKKRISKSIAVLMCLLTAVAFMPVVSFGADETESDAAPAQTQQEAVQEENADMPAAEDESEAASAMEVTPQEAEGDEETKPADPVDITVTVNNRGILAKAKDGSAMAYKEVHVTDADGDGHITVDDALVATHDAYYTDGKNGYETSTSHEYGMSVTKLWGVSTNNTLFFVNGKGISTGVGDDDVKSGDSLYASVNADNKYYADWYTYFNKSSIEVCPSEQLTLSLKGFQGMSGGDAKAVPGVEIGIWKDGSFTQIGETVTNEDGTARFSIEDKGTYIVTASGTVKDTVIDWSAGGVETEADCPIMAPVCKVTVDGDTAALIDSLKDTIATLKAAAIAPAPKASATGTTSIRLTWTVSEGVDGYELSRDGGKTWTAVTGSSRSFTGLSPATKYSYQVRGYVYLDGEGTDKYYSKAASASATTKLGTVSGVSVKSKSRKLTTKWSKVTGASSYQVYISTSSKFNKGLVKYTTKSLSKTSKKLKKGKKYYVKVRAYKNGVYGSWSSVKKVKCK